MTLLLVCVLAFALLATVFGLSRELRLRKALERLLHLLLNHRRTHAKKKEGNTQDCPTADSHNDLSGLR
jgi:hypothetical protein